MTTITIHRIDVSDLRTFRLRCGHCERTFIAEVETWTSHGGRAACPHCKKDWGATGQAFATLMAGLRELHGRENPDVFIHAEVEAQAPVRS